MKKKIFIAGAALSSLLVITGCSSLELKFDKQAGETYYVSVQHVNKHQAPCASSKVVGSLKMSDTITAKSIVPLTGHLVTDKADSWIETADGSFIPGNTVVGKELWEAQLNGIPPRGGVKVKNFTSSKDQDSDASLDMAELNNHEILLLLGANGSVKSEDGKAYPTELTKYITLQNPQAAKNIKMPVSKRGLLDFPPAASFTEVGPYQEFDMGAGLAAFMMKQALKPDHAATVYVNKIVNNLLKHSTLPYAYSGYTVLVLNDDKTVNACAAPGGFIIVTSGMIKYLKNENELALILAHEIGHLEFHHSVRSLGYSDYTSFALAALTAAIDVNDPAVKKAIRDLATEKVNQIPFVNQLPKDVYQKRLDDMESATLKATQQTIDNAKETIAQLLKIIGGSLEKGHNVEFEGAADRRAVSLAAAAGYDPTALIDVLGRIKKDFNGFGESYPVNRDELVKQFKADFSVKNAAVFAGDYNAVSKKLDKVAASDLFISK